MYEELDRHFCLANSVPVQSSNNPVCSSLVEAPRVVRAIVPLPSRTRGAVEMPILHDDNPHHHWVVRCFRCRKVGHVVSQCPRKKRNPRCTNCSSTHKHTKCPINSNTTPEAATTGVSENASGEKMMLLECIALLDWIKYSPLHCAK